MSTSSLRSEYTEKDTFKCPKCEKIYTMRVKKKSSIMLRRFCDHCRGNLDNALEGGM